MDGAPFLERAVNVHVVADRPDTGNVPKRGELLDGKHHHGFWAQAKHSPGDLDGPRLFVGEVMSLKPTDEEFPPF